LGFELVLKGLNSPINLKINTNLIFKMFEAKLSEGYVFKKIVEAIKDIVVDVNLDVGPTGKFSH